MTMQVKLIGPDRCDVPGVDHVVKPGEIVTLRDVVDVHGLPGWPEWWEVIEGGIPPVVEEEAEDDG